MTGADIRTSTPEALPRERVVAMLKKVSLEIPAEDRAARQPKEIARILKGYIEAGLRVPKILDYGSMAGLKFAARSAQKVRGREDELMRLLAVNRMSHDILDAGALLAQAHNDDRIERLRR